jgi:hypothetical protein
MDDVFPALLPITDDLSPLEREERLAHNLAVQTLIERQKNPRAWCMKRTSEAIKRL